MSWFSNIFRPRVVVQPDAECDALREHKEGIETEIRYQEQRLGALALSIEKAAKEARDLRQVIAALREDKRRFDDSVSAKVLHETIKNQTNANRRLTQALQEAEARANDEGCKRIRERHHGTRTGGF